MVLYIHHPSLLSTHLTYPWLSFSKWISVINVFHHRLHLLVQVFKIRFVAVKSTSVLSFTFCTSPLWRGRSSLRWNIFAVDFGLENFDYIFILSLCFQKWLVVSEFSESEIAAYQVDSHCSTFKEISSTLGFQFLCSFLRAMKQAAWNFSLACIWCEKWGRWHPGRLKPPGNLILSTTWWKRHYQGLTKWPPPTLYHHHHLVQYS